MRKTSEATSLLKSLHHHFSPHTTSSQVTRVLPNYYGRQALCVILPTTHNPSSTLTASILFNRNQIPPRLSVCLSRAYKARPYPFQLLPNHHPHQEHSSHSDLWVPPTFLAHSSPGPLPYSHLLFILNSIEMPLRVSSGLSLPRLNLIAGHVAYSCYASTSSVKWWYLQCLPHRMTTRDRYMKIEPQIDWHSFQMLSITVLNAPHLHFLSSRHYPESSLSLVLKPRKRHSFINFAFLAQSSTNVF